MTLVQFVTTDDDPSSFFVDRDVPEVPRVGEYVSFDDPAADDTAPSFKVAMVKWSIPAGGGAEAIVVMESAPDLDDE
ncbi:MAG: hypothetical protein WBD41_13500 [Rhodococcus sp. (in: high G+C Gram-positive bacteria)]